MDKLKGRQPVAPVVDALEKKDCDVLRHVHEVPRDVTGPRLTLVVVPVVSNVDGVPPRSLLICDFSSNEPLEKNRRWVIGENVYHDTAKKKREEKFFTKRKIHWCSVV